MAEEMQYEVGNWIYIDDYAEGGERVMGGLVQISSMCEDETSKATMVQLEFFPLSRSYDLASPCFANQDDLAKKFDGQLAEYMENG
ncbi:MAG: hypothetical protein WCO55_05450 [Candidatus Falkowbacteria bacterium]